jgi:hypothetical protein
MAAGETGIIVSPVEPIPTQPVESVHLVATNPQQMASAQANLATWLRTKRDSMLTEAVELESARDEAKRHKWKTSAFNSAIVKARKRHIFYQKTLEAVLAGYTIIPNFPIDIFAIRVTRDEPLSGQQYNTGYRSADYRRELPDIAEAGVGEYKSVKPEGYRHSEEKKKQDGTAITYNYFTPTDLAEVEFPFTVARPEIMTATAEAMTLRVFDEIGICPQSKRARGKGDPLIIGRIVIKPEPFAEPSIAASFLIAWHLDLRTL